MTAIARERQILRGENTYQQIKEMFTVKKTAAGFGQRQRETSNCV
jgi:hypothetical protein